MSLIRRVAGESPTIFRSDLVNSWKYEQYLPGFSSSDYVPQAYAHALAEFERAFTFVELLALERFNACVIDCPAEDRDTWQAIQRAARMALASFANSGSYGTRYDAGYAASPRPVVEYFSLH